MKLITAKRQPVAQPVPVDSLVAQIGGTAEQLLQRFAEVGRDFMGRPMIAFDDAQLAYAEWQRKQADDATLPSRYAAYQEDRKRRLLVLQAEATAAARASFEGRHDGGAWAQRYLEVQWAAERKVIADFEATEPELTISEFREREKQP